MLLHSVSLASLCSVCVLLFARSRSVCHVWVTRFSVTLGDASLTVALCVIALCVMSVSLASLLRSVMSVCCRSLALALCVMSGSLASLCDAL